MPQPTPVAHISDLHLGAEAYAARSPQGNNQRGEDIVRAFHNAVTDICDADVPLVLITGDIGETPLIAPRYMLAFRHELDRLSRIRPDGTRTQVAIIAGNHDQSKNLRDACWLELLAGRPGVHIATTGYKTVTFDPLTDPSVPAELAEVAVHLIPHDTLAHLDDHHIVPIEGLSNILCAHGVAESHEMYRRMVGREFPIPAELMAAGWDYVALGHYHVSGPVNLVGDTRTPTNSKAWYAGSIETIDFGDVRGASVSERYWLHTVVNPSELPTVTRRAVPTRTFVNLPPVDATDRTPEDVAALLRANIDAHPDLEGAVVRQKVVGISRELWTLVDTASVRNAAAATLNYRIDPTFTATTVDGESVSDEERGLGDVAALLHTAAEEIPERDRAAVLALCLQLVGEEIDSGDDTKDAAVTAAPAESVDPVDPPAEIAAEEASPAAAELVEPDEAPAESVDPVDPPAEIAAEEASLAASETPDGNDGSTPAALPPDEAAAIFEQIAARHGATIGAQS